MSRVSEFLEKSMVVIYSLSSHVKLCSCFVSLLVHMSNNHVAIGSKVQLCHIFFSCNSLFRARIISKLVIHFGLSTAISMFYFMNYKSMIRVVNMMFFSRISSLLNFDLILEKCKLKDIMYLIKFFILNF